VTGRAVPEQVTLGLSGYPGGTDIKGNWVTDQFQLDALGEILQLLATAATHQELDSDGWRAVEMAVAVIEQRWTEPDAGIWELDNAWWTQSRLACIAGLRQAAASAPSGSAGRFDALAAAILAETNRKCLHPKGFWQRSPEQSDLDASLLLPAIRGCLPADDPRTRRTLEAVRQQLTVDGYVYRFAPQNGALDSDEGAFLLCGFLISLADAQQGNLVEAFRWYERNRAACGSPGLLAEEFDVRQRQLRGNLPQAFVHALLLEASIRLGEMVS
jgi:GH15 family glucan-1,4-alpha-glucosidase